jgi:hypothetical protein
MELIREPVMVEWVELGEGFDGDYGEDDPDDLELLRFDFSVRGEDGDWEEASDASYCTGMPLEAPAVLKRVALEYLMDEVYEAMRDHGSAKRDCERLSWIAPDYDPLPRLTLERAGLDGVSKLLDDLFAVHPKYGSGWAGQYLLELTPEERERITPEQVARWTATGLDVMVSAVLETRPDLVTQEALVRLLSSEFESVRTAAMRHLHKTRTSPATQATVQDAPEPALTTIQESPAPAARGRTH